MYTIESLAVQSVTDDRIRRAAAVRAAKQATTASSPSPRVRRLHLWRPRRAAVPSV
jgi:hypothetical protein